MLDAHKSTNCQRPTTLFFKNSSKKTQISCSPLNALKKLKNAKKLGKKQKMQGGKKEIIKVIVFMGQHIKSLP